MNYIELLDKFFQGQTSADEEKQLRKWFSSKTADHSELSDYYRAKWQESNGDIDSDTKTRIYSKIRQSIDKSSTTGKERLDSRRRGINRILPWISAACFALIALAGWYSYAELSRVNSALFEVYTDKGQKTNITLPDGTHVWLNSGSKLSYNNGYNQKERNVTLSGEGYFEVAKDKNKRFIVHTDNYTVEALGTRFNIKSYPQDQISTTTLLEGSILIEADDTFSEIISPMQSVSFDVSSGKFTHGDQSVAQFADIWRNNELIIERGTTLLKLTEILNREYNINFVFKSDRIKNLEFEGIIKNNNLQNVLQLISLSGEVTYRIEDNTVILDKKH